MLQGLIYDIPGTRSGMDQIGCDAASGQRNNSNVYTKLCQPARTDYVYIYT